jgi:hypothetical protein
MKQNYKRIWLGKEHVTTPDYSLVVNSVFQLKFLWKELQFSLSITGKL